MSVDSPVPSETQAEIDALRRRVVELEAAPARWQQTEPTLRSIVDHHHTLIRHLKQDVFQTDAEGRWLFLSPARTEITGLEVAASLGKVFLNYVHSDDWQRNLDLLQPLIERRKADCRHEIRYLHTDGGFRWIVV
jgi:PAS domain S-box-containing protein